MGILSGHQGLLDILLLYLLNNNCALDERKKNKRCMYKMG